MNEIKKMERQKAESLATQYAAADSDRLRGFVKNLVGEQQRQMLAVYSPATVRSWVCRKNGAERHKVLTDGRASITRNKNRYLAVVLWRGGVHALGEHYDVNKAATLCDQKMNALAVQDILREQRLEVLAVGGGSPE